MGVGAAVGLLSAAGGLYSAFNSSKAPTALNPNTYNMYGQMNTPNTGGITSMNNLFGDVNSQGFQSGVQGATNNYTGALNSAANNPGIGSAYQYALGELNGNNLSNPLVNQYANQAYQSNINAAADQNARTNASFARGGMGFSTANQEAQQANTAAAASKGALARSGILSQNEQFERGLQQQAPGLINTEVAQAPNYLSQVTGAMYSPLQSQAGLTSTLVGGNQVASPTYMANPSGAQQLGTGISTANGLYSAFTNGNTGVGSMVNGIGNIFSGSGGNNAPGNSVYNSPTSSWNPGGE